ncbi:MAG TPA: GNAT family N-acyltransferase [Candidatus Saccharimonadales bacterium]|nr:GNAT family N-acyltransferase [Candidatus Saccharimonadales bacterium]
MRDTPPTPFANLGRKMPWVRPFLPIRRLDRIYAGALTHVEGNVFDGILREMDVEYTVREGELRHVPPTGPAVVFANHPFGMLDGILMASMLLRLRPDVKLLANQLLGCMEELSLHCILVDNMMGEGHEAANRRGIREALDWVKQGHMLIVFPAGEVASWSRHHRRVLDPQWNRNMARIARMAGATSVPAYISGKNSVGFHLAGMINPRLRTLFLPHELINKRGRRMEIRIGAPVESATLKAIHDDDKAIDLLRWNSSLLSLRDRIRSPRTRFLPTNWQPKHAVARPQDPAVLEGELKALPPEALLQSAGKMSVYALSSKQAPKIVRELGRLRELTFRASGEGTGKARDLDRFDVYYTHLVLWNEERKEIAGAYRICNVQDVVRRYGMRGLYTTTLFRFQPKFFAKVGPALELGRSFVALDYQRQYAPLLILWKGIGAYLVRHPETPMLFGAVSISADYSPASREVLTSYLSAHTVDAELLKMLKPKHPPRISAEDVHEPEMFARVYSLDDISDWVSMFESDGKGVPVLVKHYMKLGGKFLGFNVDAKFSNVLDGLLIVDLRQAKPDLLARYFGKEGAASFLRLYKSSKSPEGQQQLASNIPGGDCGDVRE